MSCTAEEFVFNTAQSSQALLSWWVCMKSNKDNLHEHRIRMIHRYHSTVGYIIQRLPKFTCQLFNNWPIVGLLVLQNTHSSTRGFSIIVAVASAILYLPDNMGDNGGQPYVSTPLCSHIVSRHAPWQCVVGQWCQTVHVSYSRLVACVRPVSQDSMSRGGQYRPVVWDSALDRPWTVDEWKQNLALQVQ